MLALTLMVMTVVLATGAGWAFWRFPQRQLPANSSVQFLVQQRQYQVRFFGVALVVVGVAFALSPHGAEQVFNLGLLDAAVQWHIWGADMNWLQMGLLLTAVFSLFTGVLVLPSLRHISGDGAVFFRQFAGWIVAFSAVNALSEELIYRGAVLAVADGVVSPLYAALLSAFLFAIAHIKGQANGVAVIVGSGVVGWFLAHATLQTNGLFWAWLIHFAQDIVIFTAFFAECHLTHHKSEKSLCKTT